MRELRFVALKYLKLLRLRKTALLIACLTPYKYLHLTLRKLNPSQLATLMQIHRRVWSCAALLSNCIPIFLTLVGGQPSLGVMDTSEMLVYTCAICNLTISHFYLTYLIYTRAVQPQQISDLWASTCWLGNSGS